MIEFGPFKTLE